MIVAIPGPDVAPVPVTIGLTVAGAGTIIRVRARTEPAEPLHSGRPQ